MAQDPNERLTVVATRGEYKGHALLTLSTGRNEKYPFSFGLMKAKRILACIEDIRRFVYDEENKARDKAVQKTSQPAAPEEPETRVEVR